MKLIVTRANVLVELSKLARNFERLERDRSLNQHTIKEQRYHEGQVRAYEHMAELLEGAEFGETPELKLMD